MDPVETLDGLARQGEYFVRDLHGPESVPDLFVELRQRGVRIRELREMENPLESLFA